MEECDFLDEICLTVLSAIKDVSFAAGVDTNRKLIVGKYRKANTRLTTFMIDTSNNDDHDCPASYHFYSNYLVTAIRQCYFGSSRCIKGGGEEKAVNFDVVDISNNNAKIAITPLTLNIIIWLCH